MVIFGYHWCNVDGILSKINTSNAHCIKKKNSIFQVVWQTIILVDNIISTTEGHDQLYHKNRQHIRGHVCLITLSF